MSGRRSSRGDTVRMGLDRRAWSVLAGTCIAVVVGSLVVAPTVPPDWSYRAGSLGVDHAPGQAFVFLAPPLLGVLLSLWPERRGVGIAVIAGWVLALLVLLGVSIWGFQMTLD